MSKIVPIPDLISANPVIAPQGKVRQPSNDFFKDSLNKAMGDRKATDTLAPPVALGEVRPTSFHEINSPAQRIVSQTTQLLDLLDNYASDLNNPSRSLKDMAPLVDEINANANDLLRETGQMLDPDENLRQIASEAVMTARMELIRFNRGDYVSG